jgi:glycosyltransferase involved in cell wall biosynthesis
VSELRVAYDMTFPNRNRGGTGEYARQLLRALGRRAGVAIRPVSGPARSGAVPTLDWLLRGGAAAVRRSGAQVLHCPAAVAPLGSPVPVVLTFHDDAVSRHPGGHPLEWQLFTRHALPRLLRRAAAVITPSEFVRAELLTDLRLDPERVVAVPHGVAPEFATGESPARAAGRPRLLFAGAPIERKNLGLVLAAMAAAPAGSPLAEAELLVSGAGPGSFPHHESEIARLGLGPRVRWLGVLRREAMPALYREVDVLVYPSLSEGFGLPPLEAMAAGTPVVAARASCLPETLGDAAVLVDPHDPADLAGAVEALLAGPELRARMVAAGRARAASFTWERCATATLEVYERVAGRSAPAWAGRA